MEYLYHITGMTIRILTEGLVGYDPLASFAANHCSCSKEIDSTVADLEITVKQADAIQKPEGAVLSDGDAKWICLQGDVFKTSVYIPDQDIGEVLCRADVNWDWSRAEILHLKDHSLAELGIYGFLCEILFRNRLHFQDGLVIHASGISWEGKGIMFTAPSGTGKSTQAKLWVEHLGARVLNDDRPALRVVDHSVYLYGTPWSGTKVYFENDCAPLRAIILLEQAPENRISRLSGVEAAAKIIPRCFLPYYDKAIMGMCLNALNEILATVPVYKLECRPDREAVELVRKEIQS